MSDAAIKAALEAATSALCALPCHVEHSIEATTVIAAFLRALPPHQTPLASPGLATAVERAAGIWQPAPSPLAPWLAENNGTLADLPPDIAREVDDL